MGTEVLLPEDYFRGRFRHEALASPSSTVRSRRNANCNSHSHSHASQNRRRKGSLVAVQPSQHDRYRSSCCDGSMVAKGPATNFVVGQVKILKRGETLSSKIDCRQIGDSAGNRNARAKSEEGFDLVLGSTDRLGPNPETVQKQVRVWDSKDGIYAGSAFVASPPPSLVPVPVFLGKNGSATSYLRRLLRLDLV